MSAFNLEKYVPSLGKRIPLECAFQAGKVFENGGPYSDLLNVSSRDAKRDERLRMSGRIISFEFEGNRFPTKPKTLFYDWLYINACTENIDVAKAVLDFDGFTDIEFNPQKSINCQARSVAMFVSLNKQGLLEQCRDPEEFIKLLSR